jgi:molybdopterin/thiamine biosynthesis adenylyltransferase
MPNFNPKHTSSRYGITNQARFFDLPGASRRALPPEIENLGMKPELSDEEMERYARNILLAKVGEGGQKRLKASRVAVVGAGGIGSAALFYLAAAGVGQIGVIDGDTVELSNLQRQIIHRESDLGRPKVDSAREALTALNSQCRVEEVGVRLDAVTIDAALAGYEVVLDASDNFQTRFLVADFCWNQRLPLVSAAATGFQGQLLVMIPAIGNPCYRCFYPEPPPAAAVPSSSQVGILGALAGVMGSLQALETLKLLLGLDSDQPRHFLSYDALKGRFHVMNRKVRPTCGFCA